MYYIFSTTKNSFFFVFRFFIPMCDVWRWIDASYASMTSDRFLFIVLPFSIPQTQYRFIVYRTLWCAVTSSHIHTIRRLDDFQFRLGNAYRVRALSHQFLAMGKRHFRPCVWHLSIDLRRLAFCHRKYVCWIPYVLLFIVNIWTVVWASVCHSARDEIGPSRANA